MNEKELIVYGGSRACGKTMKIKGLLVEEKIPQQIEHEKVMTGKEKRRERRKSDRKWK